MEKIFKYNNEEEGIVRKEDVEPLIIGVNTSSSQGELYIGVYADITNALKSKKDVIVKVIDDDSADEIYYVPLTLDNTKEAEEYKFTGYIGGRWVIRVTIYKNNTYEVDKVKISMYDEVVTINTIQTIRSTKTFSGIVNLGSNASATTPAETDNSTKVATTEFVKRAITRSEIINNGYEYVDLGLPSGTLWAKCNIGATNPEDYGDYFAWGETKPKQNYGWGEYKFNPSADGSTMTKYNSTDGLSELEPEDDAAHVNWGGGWQMPTENQLQELIDNCSWTWGQVNNINGWVVSGNGNSIFLPATGWRVQATASNVNISARYWSSSLKSNTKIESWYLFFDESNSRMISFNRQLGYNVRPVITPTKSLKFYTKEESDSKYATKPSAVISTITIDQSDRNSLIKVTGDIGIETENAPYTFNGIPYKVVNDANNPTIGIPNSKDPNTNIFAWIRENSKIVRGKINDTVVKGLLNVRDVDEDETYDAGYDLKTQGEFLIIPAFYWKSKNIDSDHCEVSVAKDYPGDGWHYYDGQYAIPICKVAIGAAQLTNATKITTEAQGSAYTDYRLSHGISEPLVYISQAAGKGLSRAMGKQWSLINYEVHTILILLSVGYYGRIDVRNFIGKASTHENTFDYAADEDLLDFAISHKQPCDTINNPDNTCIWGLFDWYNNVYEWMDDLVTLGYKNLPEEEAIYPYSNMPGKVGVLDYDGNIKRTIDCNYEVDVTSDKRVMGDNFDILPSMDADESGYDEDTDTNYGWSCNAYVATGLANVAYRAYGHCGSDAGLGCLGVVYSPGDAYAHCGIRLLYHGPIIEIDREQFDN